MSKLSAAPMGMGEGSNIFLGDRRHFGRTKDILREATSRGTVKRSDVEICVIFEVGAFCGRGTKTDFKDRSLKSKTAATMVGGPKEFGGTKAFKPLVQRYVIVSFGPPKSIVLSLKFHHSSPEAVFIIMSKLQYI